MKTLKETMTFDELNAMQQSHSLRMITMRVNDWYVNGQIAVFVAYTAGGQEFPSFSYRCIESGKGNSVWKFERELYGRH